MVRSKLGHAAGNWATLWQLIEKGHERATGRTRIRYFRISVYMLRFLLEAATAQIAPYLPGWLAHPLTPIGSSGPSVPHLDDEVPALHIMRLVRYFSGRHDCDYMGIKAHGATDAARNGQQLLMQVGGHAGFSRRMGTLGQRPKALKFPSTTAGLRLIRLSVQGRTERVRHGGIRRRANLCTFCDGENSTARSGLAATG